MQYLITSKYVCKHKKYIHFQIYGATNDEKDWLQCWEFENYIQEMHIQH